MGVTETLPPLKKRNKNRANYTPTNPSAVLTHLSTELPVKKRVKKKKNPDDDDDDDYNSGERNLTFAHGVFIVLSV